MAEKKLSLEEKFDNLDQIIEKLEDKDISLDESFKIYAKGMELLKECNSDIDTIEKKVQVLNKDGETHDF
jgi:exodeoxyribonuclease VII small subunit